MLFRTRKLVRPVDLNAGGSLFGGQLLKWIDEEAAIFAMCQLDNQRVTTKFLSEIDFVSPARTGDVIEIEDDSDELEVQLKRSFSLLLLRMPRCRQAQRCCCVDCVFFP